MEFEDLWQLSAADAPAYLDDWCAHVYRTRNRLDPLKDFVDTIDMHRDDVLSLSIGRGQLRVRPSSFLGHR